MAFYSTLMDAIPEYTGLSPAAFFTILALMVTIYRLVCGMFVGPDDDVKAEQKSFNPMESFHIADPVQLGVVTAEELRAYDGSDPKKPLLMAINGQIFDVSTSRMFYGPGGPYASFAGRDASRALALMSFDPQDLTGNIEGLDPSELEVLQDWECKFTEKYTKVGKLVTEKPSAAEAGTGENIKERQDQEPTSETENISEDFNNKATETERGDMDT